MSTRDEDTSVDLTTELTSEPNAGGAASATGARQQDETGTWGGAGSEAAKKKAEKKQKRKLQGWTSGADLGLLLLRLVIGGVLIAHGAQKLFGTWNGPGIDGFASALEGLGYTQTQVLSVATGVSEFAGGILIVLGLLMPLATAAAIGVMANAVISSDFAAGFFVSSGTVGVGMELSLLVGVGAAALAFTGPGRMAADNGRSWFRFAMAQGWVSIIIAAAATVLVQLLLTS